VRINQHPVLGRADYSKMITVYLDDRPIPAVRGEPVAAALYAAGRRTLRFTRNRREPRGMFCAVGRCTDCIMEIDGTPGVRTCVTPASPGMKIRTPRRGDST